MEILQIVTRPLAAGVLGQDFRLRPALAPLMDGGKVLEEKPRPMKQRSKRSVMIDGQRVNARLNIGEILQKERSHIGVDLIALWDRQISTGATSRFPTLLAPRDFGELAQSKTVPDKPRDPRQLTSTIGDTCDKAGEWCGHASRLKLNYVISLRTDFSS